MLNLVKEQLARLGIHRLHSLDKFDRLNSRNVILTIMYCIITALLFIPIFNLKTVSEFSIWFYGILTSFVLTCMYCVFVWHTPIIYRLIDNFEELIQKREYLIQNTNQYFFVLKLIRRICIINKRCGGRRFEINLCKNESKS